MNQLPTTASPITDPLPSEPERPDATRLGRGEVAVVGAGTVGAAVAGAVVLLGVSDRVVLHDRRLSRAQGEAWDVADATPMLRSAEVLGTDNWRDLGTADVVVVTVGALIRAGQSRLEERNGDLIHEVMRRLDVVAPDAVVVIVSNPVDVMTRIAQDASARPWRRILGTGTVLDTARLRQALARRLCVDAHNAHVHVIGEHGDHSFPAWSSATIGPVPLHAFPLKGSEELPALQDGYAEHTRRRGLEVLERKGHTSAGIAVAVSRIVESVLLDQGRIYTVSTRALATYGVGEEAVLSLPCIVGHEGVARRLPLALDRREQQLLERAAAVLETAYRDHSASANGDR